MKTAPVDGDKQLENKEKTRGVILDSVSVSAGYSLALNEKNNANGGVDGASDPDPHG